MQFSGCHCQWPVARPWTCSFPQPKAPAAVKLRAQRAFKRSKASRARAMFSTAPITMSVIWGRKRQLRRRVELNVFTVAACCRDQKVELILEPTVQQGRIDPPGSFGNGDLVDPQIALSAAQHLVEKIYDGGADRFGRLAHRPKGPRWRWPCNARGFRGHCR